MSDGSAVQMRILDVLDPAESSEWDALVQQHPDATAFHTGAWARVIHDSYGHRPRYLYFDSAGEPVALIPLIEVLSRLTGRRAVSLPFTDACGPLSFRHNIGGMLCDGVAQLGRERRWSYFEIRGDELLNGSTQPTVEYYGHSLDLSSDTGTIFARFSEANRRAIRRAMKNNLEVEVADRREAVEEFYKLHVQTRKKHGLPPQPLRFFANIYRYLIKPGSGFVVLVRAGNRTGAGAIFLRNAKRAIYKFGASDPDLTNYRVNNLAMWEGIQHLIQAGCEKLHFGRTSSENVGLRRFKLSWGTEEHMIRYYRFEPQRGQPISQPLRSRESGLHQRVFRNLPLVLNKLAGAILYPHLD